MANFSKAIYNVDEALALILDSDNDSILSFLAGLGFLASLKKFLSFYESFCQCFSQRENVMFQQ